MRGSGSTKCTCGHESVQHAGAGCTGTQGPNPCTCNGFTDAYAVTPDVTGDAVPTTKKASTRKKK